MSARSQLLRRELRATGTQRAGTLVALHADGADARALEPLCAAFADACDVLAPQAPRSCNPFLSSAAASDARWDAYAGYSWFRRDALGRPEPASFGDSLWQLEQLTLELEERDAGSIWLLGHREGATLALGAALAFPELLDGVIALDGAWPELPGWSDEHAVPRDLPIAELHAGYTDPLHAREDVRKILDERKGGRHHGRR